LLGATWAIFAAVKEREEERIMSLQTLTHQESERSLPKIVFAAVMCAAYAGILAALLYPIYMHLFVFD
jgi:hypothetical protein